MSVKKGIFLTDRGIEVVTVNHNIVYCNGNPDYLDNFVRDCLEVDRYRDEWRRQRGETDKDGE